MAQILSIRHCIQPKISGNQHQQKSPPFSSRLSNPMATDSPRFSIVVPIIGDDNLFEQTLASLLRDQSVDTDVILVHDGAYQDPYSLAEEGVRIVDAGSRRLAVMLNQAVAEAKSEMIAIVRPGVELPLNWQETVEPSFRQKTVASVAPVIVPLSEPSEIVAAGVTTNYGFQRILEGDGDKVADRVLSRLRPIGPTMWAAFYRRSTLEMIGNFDETIDDQYLDLDVALTLKNLGYKCHFAEQCMATITRPLLITRQADLAHGGSAQRSIVRHARGDSAIGRGMFSFAKELCCTPLQPSLFFQALGRLGEFKSKPGDVKFAGKVKRIARTMQAIEKSGLAVVASEVTDQMGSDAERTSRKPRKRAA